MFVSKPVSKMPDMPNIDLIEHQWKALPGYDPIPEMPVVYEPDAGSKKQISPRKQVQFAEDIPIPKPTIDETIDLKMQRQLIDL